jgi:hypothetical protein
MHDLNVADALAARLHLDRATILTVAEALDSLARCRSCGDDSAGLNSPALTTGRVSLLGAKSDEVKRTV